MSFSVRERSLGIGQDVADDMKTTEFDADIDEYGIAVNPDNFFDLVSGMNRQGGKLAEMNSNLGYGANGEKVKNRFGIGQNIYDEEDEEDNELAELQAEYSDLSEGTGIVRGRGGKPHSKISPKVVDFEVLAELHYVPFEGVGDAQTSRQTISLLQPRAVMVLGGGRQPFEDEDKVEDEGEGEGEGEDEVVLLENAVKLREGNFYRGNDGETVTTQIGSNAFNARLIDTPYEDEVAETDDEMGEEVSAAPRRNEIEIEMAKLTSIIRRRMRTSVGSARRMKLRQRLRR